MATDRQDGRVKIVMVGLGRIGQVHLSNVLSSGRGQVTWLVEEDELKATETLRCMGLEKVKVVNSANCDQALSDPSVDAVMICTPFPTHEAIIKKALAANKAVFSEKPLTTSAESTRACYEEAQRAGKLLFCAMNRRFDPQLRRVAGLVRAGEVGALRVVKTVSRDPPGMGTIQERPQRAVPGSIFTESAVHDLDVLCWLTGERPQSLYVTGHSITTGGQGEPDSVTIVIKFPSGVVGSTEVSFGTPIGYFQYVEAFGSQGMLVSDQQRPLQLQQWSSAGQSQQPIYDDYVDRYRDSYRLEVEHFLDLITGKVTEADVTPESVMTSAVLTQLCRKAYAKGEVMQIHWD